MSTQVSNTVLSLVEEVVKEFVDEDRSFSAFDVSKKVREKAGKVLAIHGDIKEIVHDLFLERLSADVSTYPFPSTYQRILMALPGQVRRRIWVYYNTNNNPFDYDPDAVVNVPVKDDLKDKNARGATKEDRFQVPLGMIAKAGFGSGAVIYLSQDPNTTDNKSFLSSVGVFYQKSFVVNKDGRIRLPRKALEKVYDKRINSVEFAVEGNTISITPLI